MHSRIGSSAFHAGAVSRGLWSARGARWSFAARLSAAALAGAAFVFGITSVSTARAAVLPGTVNITVPTGGFAIDGDLMANTNVTGIGDWIPGSAGSGGFVMNLAGLPSNMFTTIHIVDSFTNGIDNVYAGGDKVNDDPSTWGWTIGNASDKLNINNAMMHLGVDTNGNQWVVVAGDRKSANGNSYIDFELLQNSLSINTNTFSFDTLGPHGGRTTNDFLLTIAFENGGISANFFVQKWTETTPGVFDYVDVPTNVFPANTVLAAVSTNVIPVPYGAFGSTNYSLNLFAEGAINLTALIQSQVDPCANLGIRTVMIKTKASQSSTANIDDFIVPIPVDVAIGTANAGLDQTVYADNATSTTFTVTGIAIPNNSTITSMTWSLAAGYTNAQFTGPTNCSLCTNLTTTVMVFGAPTSTVLRLTVRTAAGCEAFDELTLNVLPYNPVLRIDKQVSTNAFANRVDSLLTTNGASVTYWFVVTNGGDVAFTNVTLVDNTLAPPFTNSIGTLSTGQVVTVSVTRVVSGSLVNTGVVTGIDAKGFTNAAADTARVVVASSSISLLKTVGTGASYTTNKTLLGTNGTLVTYWFVVSNPGNTTLTNVTLIDNFITPHITNSVGTLASGASITVSVSTAISGSLTNVATVSGVDPLGSAVAATNSAIVLSVNPVVTIAKTIVSPAGGTAAFGELFIFRVVVSNSGDTVLDTVPVTDTYNTNLLSNVSQTPPANATNLAAGTLTWSNVGPLSIGGFTTITATFNTISFGNGTNRVVTAPTLTNGIPVAPKTSSVPYLVVLPTFAINKALVSPVGRPANIGETLVFSITVSNSGTVALGTVPLTDTFNTNVVSFLSATPAASTIVGGTVTWTNVGPIPVGGTSVITVRVTAVSTALNSDEIPLNPLKARLAGARDGGRQDGGAAAAASAGAGRFLPGPALARNDLEFGVNRPQARGNAGPRRERPEDASPGISI